jgi:hypothetical protein
MLRISQANQFTLFFELTETVVTRDHVSDAGVFIRSPPGKGWRVSNADRERHTAWMRRRPIVRPWKRRRTC